MTQIVKSATRDKWFQLTKTVTELTVFTAERKHHCTLSKYVQSKTLIINQKKNNHWDRHNYKHYMCWLHSYKGKKWDSLKKSTSKYAKLSVKNPAAHSSMSNIDQQARDKAEWWKGLLIQPNYQPTTALSMDTLDNSRQPMITNSLWQKRDACIVCYRCQIMLEV